MYGIALVALLCGLSLFGQTAKPADTEAVERLGPMINAVVRGGADSGSQRLAQTILSLARDPQKPSRREVAEFVDSMAGVLAGQRVDETRVLKVSRCIVDAVRGTGPSNLALATQFTNSLAELRVSDLKVAPIVRRFMAIGEAVRGPDDAPMRAVLETIQK